MANNREKAGNVKNNNKIDWRNLPPEERPAIGEMVEVIRGKFNLNFQKSYFSNLKSQ